MASTLGVVDSEHPEETAKTRKSEIAKRITARCGSLLLSSFEFSPFLGRRP
jgi:hypothetical protein